MQSIPRIFILKQQSLAIRGQVCLPLIFIFDFSSYSLILQSYKISFPKVGEIAVKMLLCLKGIQHYKNLNNFSQNVQYRALQKPVLALPKQMVQLSSPMQNGDLSLDVFSQTITLFQLNVPQKIHHWLQKSKLFFLFYINNECKGSKRQNQKTKSRFCRNHITCQQIIIIENIKTSIQYRLNYLWQFFSFQQNNNGGIFNKQEQEKVIFSMIKMKNTELEILKPHYVNRNQKIKYNDKSFKHTCPKQSIAFQNKKEKNENISHIIIDHKIFLSKEQLKKMMICCKQSEQKWIQQRKYIISRVKQQHRTKLCQILSQIEKIRKQAYLKYRHICSEKQNNNCQTCSKRKEFIQIHLHSYLNGEKNKNQISPQEQQNSSQNKIQVIDEEGNKIKTTRKKEVRLSHQRSSASSAQYDKSAKFNKKEIVSTQSIFQIKRTNKKLFQHRNSDFKRPSIQVQELRVANRSNQRKTDQVIVSRKNMKGDYGSFNKKSSFLISQKGVGSKPQKQHERNEHSNRSINRESRNFYRKSVVKFAFCGDSEKQQQNNDLSDDKIEKSDNNGNHLTSRSGKLNMSRHGQFFDQIFEKHIVKTARPRTNKYLKKVNLDEEGNEVQLQLTDQIEQPNADVKRRRQRDEINDLIKQKTFMKEGDMQKFSRYRRERLLYDLLKQQIMKPDEQQDQVNLQYQQQQGEQTQRQANINKTFENNYSLQERKQSLISKLKMFSQSNNLINLKQRIEATLQEREQSVLSQTCGNSASKFDKFSQCKQTIQTILAEVLKIGDLKRLLKIKFTKQADWSPKMQEMHQFYTYLQYSLDNFKGGLNKKVQNNWKDMINEGKLAQAAVQGMQIQNTANWQKLQVIGQYQHHREIECSMKYYGIDVKRMNKGHHFLYDEPEIAPPIQTNVAQLSMKNIQEIDPYKWQRQSQKHII